MIRELNSLVNVAAELGISYSSVTRLVGQKKIKVVIFNHKQFVVKKELEQLVVERKGGSVSTLPDISNHKKLLEALKTKDERPFDPANNPPATLSERMIKRAESVRKSTVVTEEQATNHAYDNTREWRH